MTALATAPPASWRRDGSDWPNREHSRFVRSGAVRWHVQVMGSGPPLLLIHGTGAATHSWRDLAPILARSFTVVAPDLPGHGFTEVPTGHRLSLPGMARDLAALLGTLGIAPRLAAGHSAGAPILARMALDGQIAPAGLVSLNGAFLPLGGSAGQIFAPLARLLVGMPGLPALFAWRASDPKTVRKLLDGTGSRLDEAGVRFYTRVVRNPSHAAAALAHDGELGPAPGGARLAPSGTGSAAHRGRSRPYHSAEGLGSRARHGARGRTRDDAWARAPRA